jgi:hypothetical protein
LNFGDKSGRKTGEGLPWIGKQNLRKNGKKKHNEPTIDGIKHEETRRSNQKRREPKDNSARTCSSLDARFYW